MAGVKESLAPFDSKVVFRGQLIKILAGDHEHDNVVVLEFPDQTILDNWYGSEKYQSLIPLRNKAANIVLMTYKA